jgi:hypothetical protein
MLECYSLFAWLISHQPAVLFSRNKSAINNQPAVLFSQNKPAPAISHQPNEHDLRRKKRPFLFMLTVKTSRTLFNVQCSCDAVGTQLLLHND